MLDSLLFRHIEINRALPAIHHSPHCSAQTERHAMWWCGLQGHVLTLARHRYWQIQDKMPTRQQTWVYLDLEVEERQEIKIHTLRPHEEGFFPQKSPEAHWLHTKCIKCVQLSTLYVHSTVVCMLLNEGLVQKCGVDFQWGKPQVLGYCNSCIHFYHVYLFIYF